MRGTGARCVHRDRDATQTGTTQIRQQGHLSSTFASYLNLRLNRCFVLIDRNFTNFLGKFATETDLTDAISRHGYAFYSDNGGKMLTCDLSPAHPIAA
jgi:hypothetical protein